MNFSKKDINFNNLLKLKSFNLNKMKYDNKKLSGFLLGERNFYNILNLEKILLQWFKIKTLIKNIIQQQKKILVIHTNTKYKLILEKLKNQTVEIYYDHWFSGLITNYYCTRWAYKTLKKTDFLMETPGLIILFDCTTGTYILNEAKIKNIPVIGFMGEPLPNNIVSYPLISPISKTSVVYFYYNLLLKLFLNIKSSKPRKLNYLFEHFKQKRQQRLKKIKKKLIFQQKRRNWYLKKKKLINFYNAQRKNFNKKNEYPKKGPKPKFNASFSKQKSREHQNQGKYKPAYKVGQKTYQSKQAKNIQNSKTQPKT